MTEDQVKAIGKVDLLLIPFGGKMSLNGLDATKVMQQLKPAVTIPMHYRTKALSILGLLLFDKVDKFIDAAGQRTTEVRILDINTENLSQYSGVVTMQYQ